MSNFFEKIIAGNDDIPCPNCLTNFNANFPDAIAIEWFKKEQCYEAIFYRNGTEYIALFDLSGNLNEYRQNLTAEYLPVIIKNTVSPLGEIMNVVLRNKGNRLEYEIILRDETLKRYLITLADSGEIIDKKLL